MILFPLWGCSRCGWWMRLPGRPIEGAAVSYGTVGEVGAQAAELCADYALLVPLKRSRAYRAIRPRVSDLRPSDAWQQDGLHFFVFAVHRFEGDSPSPADALVAVFAMRPDAEDPVSAVVVRPCPDGLDPEITPIVLGAETASAAADLYANS